MYKGRNKGKIKILRTVSPALASVAQWIECGPANQRVTISIPSAWKHTPGLWARSPVGGAQDATTH